MQINLKMRSIQILYFTFQSHRHTKIRPGVFVSLTSENCKRVKTDVSNVSRDIAQVCNDIAYVLGNN